MKDGFMNVNCLLYEDFETLDLFGPVEVLSYSDTEPSRYFSVNGGIVRSRQNTPVLTEKIDSMDTDGILLIPGGVGARALVNDDGFVQTLKALAEKSLWCLTVCTGSALLASTGLLDGRQATSNKLVFTWVTTTGTSVLWQKQARWVVDGKYYTSSGVTAGIDMSLGFVADRFTHDKAIEIANYIEYEWQEDKTLDPFANLY
jgi:putative intracellular protease/amidase